MPLALCEGRSWGLHPTSDYAGPEGSEGTFRTSAVIGQAPPVFSMLLQPDFDIEH